VSAQPLVRPYLSAIISWAAPPPDAARTAQARPSVALAASPPKPYPACDEHGRGGERRRTSAAALAETIRRLAFGVANAARALYRLIELGALFGPLVLTCWLLFLPGAAEPSADAHTQGRRRPTLTSAFANAWWRWLRLTVEASGPCVIKLAQWASSRPDLFSDRVAVLFADITDRVRPHSMRATRRALAQAFGAGWEEQLTLSSDEPIGSGCIAQVYRATLRGGTRTPNSGGAAPGRAPEGGGTAEVAVKVLQGGTRSAHYSRSAPELALESGGTAEVAVKVRHPAVARAIETDLALLSLVCSALALVPGASLLDPRGIAAEFGEAMRGQLDLSVEARNLDELAANFATEPRVRFPRPAWPWVSESVLVEELLIGRPVLESVGSSQRALIARVGLEAVLKMLFVDNCVHADLHPGNILVLDAPAGGRPTRADEVVLGFLDAGIVKRISADTFGTVVGVLGAMVHYDGQLAGELILQHRTGSAVPPRTAEQTRAFCDGICAIVEHARKPEVNFFDHIGEYVSTILRLAWTHRVQLAPDFVAVAVAVRVVEGIAHQLDPEILVAPLCRPYYRRAILEHNMLGLPFFRAAAEQPAAATSGPAGARAAPAA
jgi:aarF domain-containing kinase